MKLFLDDLRFPPNTTGPWILVRSVPEAIAWIEANGCPQHIAFDHDLATGTPEGWVLAQWLIETDLDHGGNFLPHDFTFSVHSDNPWAPANIQGRLDSYLCSKTTLHG